MGYWTPKKNMMINIPRKQEEKALVGESQESAPTPKLIMMVMRYTLPGLKDSLLNMSIVQVTIMRTTHTSKYQVDSGLFFSLMFYLPDFAF
jgi:hypothetical protein